VPAVVFVPATALAIKVARLKAYGAAVASDRHVAERDERVAVVLCGANTDPRNL
jgi:threonine dehydratase